MEKKHIDEGMKQVMKNGLINNALGEVMMFSDQEYMQMRQMIKPRSVGFVLDLFKATEHDPESQPGNLTSIDGKE